MILLIGNDDVERSRIAGLLRDAKLDCTVPRDAAETQVSLRDFSARVVLVCVAAADESLIGILKSLDQKRGARSTVVGLVCDEIAEELLGKLMSAGLDCELRRKRGREYVLAHIHSLLRLARRPPSEVLIVEPRPQAPASPTGSTLECVTRAAGWRDARELVIKAAAAFLTVPAKLATTRTAEADLSAGCQIVMGNSEDKVELRLSVGAPQKSLKHLAMHVFGDDGDEMGVELLSELTNIFMGALKTTFSEQSVKFAAGLPEAVPPSRVLSPAVMYGSQDSFELQVGDARVIVYVGVRSSGAASVPVSTLLEGMVVAKDVFNPKGLMLVRGGTRLSLNMVEKLRGMLSPKDQVEVMAT